jgi:hypothetical protein
MNLAHVKAVVAIHDGGHRLKPGDTDEVLPGIASAWIDRGWAEEVRPRGRPRKAEDHDVIR